MARSGSDFFLVLIFLLLHCLKWNSISSTDKCTHFLKLNTHTYTRTHTINFSLEYFKLDSKVTEFGHCILEKNVSFYFCRFFAFKYHAHWVALQYKVKQLKNNYWKAKSSHAGCSDACLFCSSFFLCLQIITLHEVNRYSTSKITQLYFSMSY